MEENRKWTFKYRILLLVGSLVIVVFVYLAFKFIFPIVSPFVIAYAIALAIEKPVKWLARIFKGKRTIASSIIVILLSFFIIITVGYIIYLGVEEIRAFIKNSDYYLVLIRQQTARVCVNLDHWLGVKDGCCMEFLCGCAKNVSDLMIGNGGVGVAGKVIKISIPVIGKTAFIIGATVVSLLSVVYISNLLEKVRNWRKTTIFIKEAAVVTEALKSLINVYFKVQGLIMLINSVVCIVGLFIIKNPYAVVIGIIIGIVDALPLFGTGVVLVPWAVIHLLMKNIFPAAVLITVYLITYFVREIMESKCMGDKLNISAFTMIMVIYVGFIVYGIMGFILGPLSYCIIKALIKYYKEVLLKDLVQNCTLTGV